MGEIVSKILNMMPDSNHSKCFVRSIINRLTSIGYTPNDMDAWEISFAMMNVENHIKNSCNTTSIPEGLQNTAVDMICGQFLKVRKDSGRLQVADLDLSGAITSITEGDVSITFDSNETDEQKLNHLISYLTTKGEGEFVCYRQLRW